MNTEICTQHIPDLWKPIQKDTTDAKKMWLREEARQIHCRESIENYQILPYVTLQDT